VKGGSTTEGKKKEREMEDQLRIGREGSGPGVKGAKNRNKGDRGAWIGTHSPAHCNKEEGKKKKKIRGNVNQSEKNKGEFRSQGRGKRWSEGAKGSCARCLKQKTIKKVTTEK